MVKQGVIETVVGFIIIIVAAGFFWFAYNLSSFSKVKNGYSLSAKFENIDGISKGSDVKLAGIKIGQVGELHLEQDYYYVTVTLFIDDDVLIPEDSRAIISTNGLLGAKYVRITPGGSDDSIENGGNIKFTQSALNIEDLIGKLMYSLTSK